ncbi:hypothetical protein LPB248_05550 [Flavobacterium sp. LPB0248]|uniref:hypothetical protein n=1 Tax=Flavobacterium sp. LPB0248 TaxID=2614441 RepID=UPI0015A59867|nr:hypothetical protein [Flavobacterium sp. LPB0248]QLC65775.1 hypothetical protein LPB248_05550 [Flavobacterium sp. LPB0248]
MALNSNGSLSLGNICTEKTIPSTNASLTTLSTTNINVASSAKPNGTAPHSISEFYNYNHSTIPPSITITSYSSGYLYFTLNGTGYSTSAVTVKKSTVSANGPWSNDTNSSISPRNVGIPSVTTWYQIQDAINPSIFSNVYQYVISDTTAPPAPTLTGIFNNPQRALTLNWNAVTDPSSPVSYKIYSSNVQQTVTSATTITLYGAWIFTGYNSWTVRSVDAVGNTSPNSNAYTFTAS